MENQEKRIREKIVPPGVRGRWGNARRLAAVVLSILAAGFSLSGTAKTKDPPWVGKDWTQWTEKDCSIVLNKSPWVQTITAAAPGAIASFGGLVQLRSALPIRQALLRRQQLKEHYEKLGADKKQAFDQAHLNDLDPSGQVLVYLAESTFASLPNVVFLGAPKQVALRLSDGTLIQPTRTNRVNYAPVAAGSYANQIEYAFPRTSSGKPLYYPGDSSLRIELGAPLASDKKSDQPEQQAFRDSGLGFTFKISDLMYKGKLEY
ncbi:MAG TPA: hypothetical protein VGZ48_02865 [Candidatus Acidoferrales bacterium]|nr:hypothetical protein [Candidatus Acidoferrales bacterium]